MFQVEASMVLPILPNVYFSHACPSCGHVRSETGLWFRAIGFYKCNACSAQVKLTYDEKVRLLCGENRDKADPQQPTLPSDAPAQQPPSRR
jgi:hypothetical protein